MKATLNKTQFVSSFLDVRPNDFSREALEALYDWYEEMDGGETEFDPIAITCDWTEYEIAEDCAMNYFEFEGMEFDNEGVELNTADEVEKKALEFLQERTLVIKFDKGIIVQDF